MRRRPPRARLAAAECTQSRTGQPASSHPTQTVGRQVYAAAITLITLFGLFCTTRLLQRGAAQRRYVERTNPGKSYCLPIQTKMMILWYMHSFLTNRFVCAVCPDLRAQGTSTITGVIDLGCAIGDSHSLTLYVFVEKCGGRSLREAG